MAMVENRLVTAASLAWRSYKLPHAIGTWATRHAMYFLPSPTWIISNRISLDLCHVRVYILANTSVALAGHDVCVPHLRHRLPTRFPMLTALRMQYLAYDRTRALWNFMGTPCSPGPACHTFAWVTRSNAAVIVCAMWGSDTARCRWTEIFAPIYDVSDWECGMIIPPYHVLKTQVVFPVDFPDTFKVTFCILMRPEDI